MHRCPVAQTVAMPGAAQGLDRAVLCFEPFTELGLRCRAETLLYGAFVPHIVAIHGGIVTIALDECRQEFSGLTFHFLIVKTQRRATGGATAADRGIALV